MALLHGYEINGLQEAVEDIRTNLAKYRGRVGGLYIAHGMGIPGCEEHENISIRLKQIENFAIKLRGYLE